MGAEGGVEHERDEVRRHEPRARGGATAARRDRGHARVQTTSPASAGKPTTTARQHRREPRGAHLDERVADADERDGDERRADEVEVEPRPAVSLVLADVRRARARR